MPEYATSLESVTWWEYVQQVAGGASNATIAAKVGVTAPSVGRWKNGGADAATVARFAREFGRPVLEALIAAGYITADEAGQTPSAPVSLEDLDDAALVREIAARLERGRNDRQPSPEKSSSGPRARYQRGASIAPQEVAIEMPAPAPSKESTQ